MKGGKLKEPPNKAKLRLEAFKAARGLGKKHKSIALITPGIRKDAIPDPNVTPAKTENLPAKEATAPDKKALSPKGASSKKRKLTKAKRTNTKKTAANKAVAKKAISKKTTTKKSISK